MIRKATGNDLEAVVSLYDEIHCAEESGLISTGWKRGIYPSRQSALAALERDDLFVLEEDGRIIGSGIINQIQVDVYAGAPWKNDVPDEQVCVLHTLMISPAFAGKGNARKFLAFYEEYARQSGCPELRIDTNVVNKAARAMYRRHGYEEIDIVPTVFNGIPGINLVLLEKHLKLNYICKIASMEEMEQKWDYEISLHSEKENWIAWKAEAMEGARTGRSIPYYGILDGTVICEATAVLNPDFGQASVKAEHTVELCAFRTNREYRGKGYFSKLMEFLQKDLKQKGYRQAVVGVEPEEKRNREIYRHWGFTEDAGTGTETYPDGTVIQIEFCGKQL